MEYAVSRDGTALVTLHEGTDTTACEEARAELAASLESLTAADGLREWEVPEATVYEPPTAPFDPYTIAVSFRVVVSVDADDRTRAAEVGASAIDDALESAGLESVSYTSSPVADAA